METGPILRAMLRHKTGAVLIALQIAFTMTVVVNAYFIVVKYVDRMNRPSGLAEDELFHITSTGYGKNFNAHSTVQEDLDLLRHTPGVVDAVQIEAIPLSGGGWGMGLSTEPGTDKSEASVAVYMVDDHGLGTLGLKLIAGSNFDPTDVVWRKMSDTVWPPKGILSEAAAKAIFPDASPQEVIGRTVYISDTQPITVIGIVERLQAPWTGSDRLEQSLLVPQLQEFTSTNYMVRTEPGRRDEMMPIVEELLARSNDKRILRENRSMAETRERSYRGQRSLAIILVITTVILVIITALGIVGLASFSVTTRTKQIGTRRALGASRRDIIRYFLVENLMITTIGVALGGAMSIGFNLWLVNAMRFPKIDWLYLPAGMLALWAIGQLAVLGPALRASDIPPAVATRTV